MGAGTARELSSVTKQTPSDTISLFFQHLDAAEFEKLAALMAADGVWHRQGKALVGPDMVRQAMRERPKDLSTCHIVSNLVVDAVDADHAQASFYNTVFAHTGEAGEGPAPLDVPMAIYRFETSLVRVDGGWRFAKIGGRPMFRRR